MFYDIFEQLCKEKGVTPVRVRKELNIGQSTMASWKSRKLQPNAVTLIALAEYFNTSPAYLMGNPVARDQAVHLSGGFYFDGLAEMVNDFQRLDDVDKKQLLNYKNFLLNDEKYLHEDKNNAAKEK